MAALKNKIDFCLVFTVRNANPNGDPLDGNRPRTTYDGLGEVSDVCLKRKIRNRLLDEGEAIFVQSDDRRVDEYRALKARADSIPALVTLAREKKREEYGLKACEIWYDVRAFGQVFAFKDTKKAKKGKEAEGEEGDESGSDAVSIGIRGPVSIQPAFSIDPVTVTSTQITKSVNLEVNEKDPDRKAADTMGMKHRVDYGAYRTFGAISPQAAEKTGFSDADAEKLKEALRTLFRNDATSARPDGSMEVVKLIWWKHDCKNGQHSAAKLMRTVKVVPGADGTVEVLLDNYPDLIPEVIDGE